MRIDGLIKLNQLFGETSPAIEKILLLEKRGLGLADLSTFLDKDMDAQRQDSADAC